MFYGVEEGEREKPEETEMKVRYVIKAKLGLVALSESVSIARCHRVGLSTAYGTHRERSTRPVVCKFELYKDRQAVGSARGLIRQSSLAISVDFPPGLRDG